MTFHNYNINTASKSVLEYVLHTLPNMYIVVQNRAYTMHVIIESVIFYNCLKFISINGLSFQEC